MTTSLMQSSNETNVATILSAEAPVIVHLQIAVTDPDSVRELTLRHDGRERDEYALCALRIGLLSLKHARGQVDADAVKRESDRLLQELNHSLEGHTLQLNESVTAVLRDYFDPTSGRLQERLERLIRKDGELEQLLRRQIGSEDSELAKTLTQHVGGNSRIMKLLDPRESTGLLQAIQQSAEEVLRAERNRILSEFSLDNKDSALSRMVSELTEENGRLKQGLTNKVDEVVREFSLDKEDSALSRLVRKVETAQRTITNEFSLDNDSSALSKMSNLLNDATDAIHNNLTLDKEGSALARLKRELVEILNSHEEKATVFQRDVTTALEAMKARREESLRSTTHGRDFEDVVVEFVQKDAAKSGDIATSTGCSTGLIKYCKVGDSVVELGPDCAAAGEKFVVEAKEDISYDLSKARSEIDTARKNRGASIGLFVFSSKTAPKGQPPLVRLASDIFVVWDDEDLNSDGMLRAALLLAKALCAREAKTREAEAADFQAIDGAILAIETEAGRLVKMKTFTETVKSSSEKLLEEIRKLTGCLERQMQVLRDAISGLRESVVQRDKPRSL